jgi:phosphopantetheinyl transferase
MLSIWTIDSKAWEAHDETCVLPLLSASEHKQLAKRTHPTKRLEYLRSRYFVRYALSHLNLDDGLSSWRSLVLHDEGKGPLLTRGDVYLSLSHTRSGWMALAISHQSVGIDIEQDKKQSSYEDRLAAALSEESLDRLISAGVSTSCASTFYSHWCMKEARFKCLSNIKTQHGLNPLLHYGVWHSAKGYWLSIVNQVDCLPKFNHLSKIDSHEPIRSVHDWVSIDLGQFEIG